MFEKRNSCWYSRNWTLCKSSTSSRGTWSSGKLFARFRQCVWRYEPPQSVVRCVWKYRQSTNIFWRMSLRFETSLVSSFQRELSRNDPLFIDKPTSRGRPQSLPVHSTDITVQLLKAWRCHSPVQSHFRGNGYAWLQWSVQRFLSMSLHLTQAYSLYRRGPSETKKSDASGVHKRATALLSRSVSTCRWKRESLKRAIVPSLLSFISRLFSLDSVGEKAFLLEVLCWMWHPGLLVLPWMSSDRVSNHPPALPWAGIEFDLFIYLLGAFEYKFNSLDPEAEQGELAIALKDLLCVLS